MCVSHAHSQLPPPDERPAADHQTAGDGTAPPRTTRRDFLVGAAAATIGAAVATLPRTESAAAVTAHAAGRIGGLVDLTHAVAPTFPMYPVFTPPTRHPAHHVETSGFYMQHWQLWEHTSTHIDAPCHFSARGRTLTEIGLEELVGVPLCVIDISHRAATDPDTVVTVEDLERFEATYGRIPAGAAVIMNSGWSDRVDVPGAYQNPGADGRLHFPGWSVGAVTWLLGSRDARAIGVDTLSLDEGRAIEAFPVHELWLGADRWALECVANLGAVPPAGTQLFVGVAKFEEASGAPCRVVAMPAHRRL